MIDTILHLLAPHSCLGCSAEGYILCPRCRHGDTPPPSLCYRCGVATTAFATCSSCRRQTKLVAVYVAAAYQGAIKDAVWKLKFEGTRAGAKDMAAAMAEVVTSAPDALIVHVPTATSHIRRRGYDQARLLARALAKQTSLPYAPCLVRLGQQRQVGASRKQRFEQLSGAFRLASGYDVTGKTILLVDDVLTTGATLEAAAAVLKKAGAKRAEAVVFARA